MKPINELVVLLDGQVVGELVLSRRDLYFAYDAQWLRHGFPLSPLNMQFDSAPQLAADTDVFGGLHGVFADSLPDGWGTLLMDRFFLSLGVSKREITPLDRLAYMADRGMGALEYRPVLEREAPEELLDLASLYRETQRIYEGETHQTLNAVRLAGGSPGGARPKVIVAFSHDFRYCTSAYHDVPSDMGQWLVKFRAPDEHRDTGAVEFAYSLLAQRAGLEMSDCELLTVGKGSAAERFFATRRFDRRPDGQKVHMLTAAAILYADYRKPVMDYKDHLAATSAITASAIEVERMARLMIFNALFHNHDDHAKNFAYVRSGSSWVLSPAYDLTYAPLLNFRSDEHTSTFLGRGLATYQRVRELCRPYTYLDPDRIIGEVLGALDEWPSVSADLCIEKGFRSEIQKAMNANRRRFEEGV